MASVGGSTVVASSRSFRRLNESDDCDTWMVAPVLPPMRITFHPENEESGRAQEITIDVIVVLAYKEEGADRFQIRLQVTEILWQSNMLHNEPLCRGFFIDGLDLRFQPLWDDTNITTMSFNPSATNVPTMFSHGTQAAISGKISRNPSIGGTLSILQSQQTEQPMYLCRWVRGRNGITTFTWRLNLWYGSSSPHYPDLYEHENKWGIKLKVPALLPDYGNGDFNGLGGDFKPSVVWFVPASVVIAGQLRWNFTVRASVSKVRIVKKACFLTKTKWTRESFSHSAPLAFDTADQMVHPVNIVRQV